MKKQTSSFSKSNCFASIFLLTTFFALCFFSFFTFHSLKNEYLHNHLIKLVNLTTSTTKPQVNDNFNKLANFSSIAPSNDVVEGDNIDDDNDDDEFINQDSLPSLNDTLFPPQNVPAEQRIAWFKEKLPRIRILHSTRKTKRFNKRVLEFLEGQETKCNVKIFMTWIAPSSLFVKRYLLSLETIFKSHPKGCVVIVSPSLDSRDGSRILEPLMSRGFRVLPLAPDLPSLVKGTPAQAWIDGLKNGTIDPGKITITQNLSNLLRLLLIYKYGGIYLDMDFVILKDMSGLRNSIGIQAMNDVTKRWRTLNNALLIFDKEHPLVLKFIEEFVTRFDGSVWGHNGPYMVTRVVKKVINREPRLEFNILSQMAFYPVDWVQIGLLFKRPNSEPNKKFVEDKLVELDGKSYGIHLWNKFSKHLKIEHGGIMGRLISDHCVICENVYDDDDNDQGPKASNSTTQ